MGAAGFTYLDAHFDVDCPDEEWIPEVGRRGWVAVTRDKKIRGKRRTRDVVAGSQLRLFVFNQAADMNRLDLLEALTRHWRKMLEFSAENDPPAIITISKTGEFSRYL